MHPLLNVYGGSEKPDEIIKQVKQIISNTADLQKIQTLRKVFSLLDLTSLDVTDTDKRIETMCKKINEFHSFPKNVGTPNIAAICVFPVFVKTAKRTLNARGVKIASVAAGFPASQTFLTIKTLESKMAVEDGADEIDVVMPIGKFLEGEHQAVFDEIAALRLALGQHIKLKIILETGILAAAQNIRVAALMAMEAGCDFIKTSTGKVTPGASLDAVYVMCEAIKAYHLKTGKRIGIKPAGGIANSRQALSYLAVVKHVLGDEWIKPELFRLGASRLANDLLTEISILGWGQEAEINYF